MSLDRRLVRAGRLIDAVAPAQAKVKAPDLVVPNPVEFATDERYLGQPLAPRPGTLLKVIFLRDDLFTEFDLRVIEEWQAGFTLPDPDDQTIVDDVVRYHGTEGAPPDLLERIRRCKADGRRWFGEVVFVGGRRGGKGHVGAIAGLYVTWHLLVSGDPQAAFGIAPTKQLQGVVFAGNRQQAQSNQFADLSSMAREAPCFRPFLDRSTTSGSAVGLMTPAQLAQGDERDALLMLVAKATTALGGRGPATFMAYFDEFAHSQGAGSTSDSEELWQAVTPSLAQCGMDGFVYQGSSPWAQDGQFFVNYRRGSRSTLSPPSR